MSARRLLLGLLGGTGGAASVSYLLRDQFTTAEAAPLTTPRTAEPGPGTLTIVDSANRMSISDGQFVVNGAVGANDKMTSASTFARAAGRAFLFGVPTRTTVNTNLRLGFDSSNVNSATDYGLDYSSANVIRIKIGTGAIDTYTVGASSHDFACVMRGTGGFLLARNGGTGVYTLLWVYNTVTSAQYAKFLVSGATTLNFVMDDWRVTDLGGAWATDYGIATDRVATTQANDTLTATADAIVEHTITAATGVTQELMLRRTDDNNCWIVRMDQTGSTIKLIEKNAGVETERNSAAQTWTNATQYRIVATLEGQTIKTYVANATKNSYGSASFNLSATGVKVSHAGSDLVCWPRTIAVAA